MTGDTSISQMTSQLPLIKVKPLPDPVLNHKETTVVQKWYKVPGVPQDFHGGWEKSTLFSW